MKKKQFARLICFLILVCFLGKSLSYIVRTNGVIKDRFAGFYAEPKDSIEVMMYGASPVGASFAPGLLWKMGGVTSYPLSTNSQSPVAIKYLIEETYKYQHPGLIIIEPRMFCSDPEKIREDKAHIREVTDNLRYSLTRKRMIDAMLSDDDNKVEYYVDIIKYHSNIGMLLDPDEWKKYDYSVSDPDKGFQYQKEINAQAEFGDTDDKEVMPIPKECEDVLLDLLEYLKDQDADVLFVATPRFYEYEYECRMNYIRDIVEKSGYSFLNMNRHLEEMGFDLKHDFNDGVHVNLLGSYKCSTYLAQYINTHYDFSTDLHTDTGSWDAAYDRYMEEYNGFLDQVEDY
ncbi:MAG: SGNH/GDSL hydrolase family protein [Lachnospiraceae bacterium]|nr:SGNH/GDSL hydrolase family protein [Lachnospiraceae bacterium]